ncbi:MAG: hypothetical protein Q9218_000380 [Villophora microphyllina]
MATIHMEFPWLRSTESLPSRFGNHSMMELPAVRFLEYYGNGGKGGRALAQAIRLLLKFQDDMRSEWRLRKGAQMPGPPGPLLINEKWCLEEFYKILDSIFFLGTLEEIATPDWCPKGVQPEWVGDGIGFTQYTNGRLHVYVVKEPTRDPDGFYTGEEALRAMTTLLHEMVHAYQNGIYLPDRLGRKGHGNFFLHLSGLIENVANRWLGMYECGISEDGKSFDDERQSWGILHA